MNKWEIIKKTISICLILSITLSVFISPDVVQALSQEMNVELPQAAEDKAIELVYSTPSGIVVPTPMESGMSTVTASPAVTPTQEISPSPTQTLLFTPMPLLSPLPSPEFTSTPFPSPLPFPSPEFTSTSTPDPDSTPTPTVSPTPLDVEAPSKPECIISTDRTDTTISLSWSQSTDNVGVKGYYIYRDGVKLNVDVTEPYFTDEGLTENTTYKYCVTAYDEAGNESERSTELVVMTLANNITELNAVVNEDGSILVSWNQVARAAGYELIIDEFESKYINETSYLHTGLLQNTRHTYRVRVKFASNSYGAWSEKKVVFSFPGKPMDVDADIIDDNSAKIFWNGVQGISKYNVYRNGELVAAEVTALEFTDTGLTAGKDYEYEVKAVAGGSESLESQRVIVNTGAGSISTNTVLYENRVYKSFNLKSRIINLNGYRFKVEADLIQTGGTLDVNGGRLEVAGNYTISEDSYFEMTEEDGYVLVRGNFKTISKKDHTGKLTAGTMEVKGDFIQINGTHCNFYASGSHRVILSGEDQQTIGFFSTMDKFNILENRNTSGKELIFEKIYNAEVFINNTSGLSTMTVDNHAWSLTGDEVINGDLYIKRNTLDLGGKTLKVNGNLIQTGGTLDVNGGRLEIAGDYKISGSSYLEMTREEDYVLVGGNFETKSSYNHEGKLTAGTIEVKGNFTQINGTHYNFDTSGTHKVVLSGEKQQTINFFSGISKFNILENKNTSGKELIFKDRYNVGTFINNTSGLSTMTVDNHDWNLTGNEVINGDLYVEGHTLNLAGKALKVNGNLIQTGGTLDINGGVLEVTGNYTMGGRAYLEMTQEDDYILVGGNFETKSSYSHEGKLTAGTIEVKGNFAQKVGNNSNFKASGTHKVILSGSEVQNIYFDKIAYSKINILIITKPLSEGYTYNVREIYDSKTKTYYYELPWKNLIEQFDPNPQPGTMISKASLEPARKGLGLAEVNAKLYAFGGSYPDPKSKGTTIFLDTVSEYDPVKNLWIEYAPGSSPNPNKKMREPKSNMAVASTDNRIYLIGGFDGFNYLNTVEVYNTSIAEFDNSVAFPAISEAKSGAGAVVIGDKLYVIGGYNGLKYSDTVEVCDLSADNPQWTVKPKTSNWMTPRADFGIATYGGKIYVFGGRGQSGYLSSIQEYDPQTNTWKAINSKLAEARAELKALTMSGKIYILGGTNNRASDTVEEFDPHEKTIKKLPRLNRAKSSFGAVVAYNKIYIVGGTDGYNVLSEVHEYFTQVIPGLTYLDGLNGLEGNSGIFDLNGVNNVSGSYSTQVEDFRIDSPAMDVAVTRTYNSNNIKVVNGTVQEDGWSFNFESSISEKNDGIYKRVTASALNLRQEPPNIEQLTYLDPMQWRIIKSLAYGSIVEFEGYTLGNKWIKVKTIDGLHTGWVCTDYIEDADGMEVTYPSGAKAIFRPTGNGKYLPPPGIYDELRDLGNNVFRLTTKEDQITYEYHDGNLVKMIDRYGNIIKYHYEDGKLKKLYDCEPNNESNSIGRVLTFNYDGNKLRSVQDNSGRTVTYTYDKNGMLEAVKDLNGYTTKYLYYNADDEIEGQRYKLKTVSKINDSGEEVKILTNVYDGYGRMYKQYDTEGRPTYYLYTDLICDEKGEQPTDKNEVARTVFDKRGKISKEIYNINFAGKPLKTIDAKGRETTYKYEIRHNTGIIDITNFTYNDLKKSPAYDDIRNKNLPEIVTATFNESTTKVEKDGDGNIILITYPDNSTRKYSYYENGDLMYEIDQMNQQTFYMYENYEPYQEKGITKYRSRLTRIVKPVESGVVYTSTKLPTDSVLKAGDAVTRYKYVTGYNKIKGCLIEKITYPNGTWTTYKYNNNGNLLATSDKIDLTVSNDIDAAYKYEYDNCFRVSSVSSPIGYKTEYRYNNTNQITHTIKKDLVGETVSIHRTYYDYDGRKKKEVNPVMYNSLYDTGKDYIGTASMVYEYDVYGRVTKLTNNVQGLSLSSTITKYEYDAEGNIIGKQNYSKASTGADEVLESYYIYEYDSLNRLEATYFKDDDSPDTSAVKLEEYIYEDIYGDNIRKSKKIYKQYLNDGKFSKTEYIYDHVGREVEVIHPDETNVISTVTTYYPDGNVKTVKDPRGSISHYTYRNYDLSRNLYYDEKYTPVEKLNSNNYEISYSRVNYDRAGRKVEEIKYVDLIAATLNSDGTYSMGSDALAGKKYNSISYLYYNDNKVKQENSSNGKKVEYFYDDDGNLIEERTTFDKDVYGRDRKRSVLYLDYNAYGKPEKTAVLVKNEDISRDMVLNGDNVVPFERLFPVNNQGITDYGSYEYHDNCSAIVTTYTDFDALGNAQNITYPSNFTEKYSYDSLGRVIKKSITIRDMENPESSGRYKTVENITTYNWEGKIVKAEVLSKYENIVEKLSSTAYKYDGRGFMVKTTTDVMLNKYDEVNKTVKQEKESVTTAYEYDTAGRLIAEVSAQNYIEGKKPSETGNHVKYTYYDSGRLKAKSFEGITKKYNPTTKAFEDVASSIVIEAYAYDENGNVTKKVDGEAYNKAGGSIDNAYGIEYTYNLASQVKTEKDPEFTNAGAGRNFNKKYLYDGVGRVVQEYSAYGKDLVVTKYDSTTPEIASSKVGVSGLGYALTRYAYDDANRKVDVYVLEDIDNPLGEEVRVKTEIYDYAGNIKSITDAKGNRTVYEYNNSGNLRSVTYPSDESIESNTVEYKYDSMGNVKSEKNGLDVIKEYEYDEQGRLLSSKIYGSSGIRNETTTRYGYDLLGNLVYEIDPNGNVTKHQYDELGRVIKTIVNNKKLVNPDTKEVSTSRASQHEEYICYDKNGNVVKEVEVVKSIGKTTKSSVRVYAYKYDNMGRLIEKVDPSGAAIEKINYNLNSAQIQSFDGENHIKEFEYNKNGMLVTTRDYHDGNVVHEWKQTYDAAGNILTKDDGCGNETVYIYNGYGQLTEVKLMEYDSVGSNGQKRFKDIKTLTRYSYDANGNMESQSFEGKPAVGYEYNAMNLIKKKIYPGTVDNAETYSYYKDGTLKQKIDRNNVTTTYQYYPQGWLAEENAVKSGDYTKRIYTYDNNGNMLEATVETSRGTGNSVIRTYDDLNRVIAKAVTGVTGKTVYVYDIITDYGMIAETAIDQKSNMTTKVYDAVGRLEYVKDGSETAANIAYYTYYKNGARKSVVYKNGAKEEYEYYDDGLLKKLVNTMSGYTETYVYTYDASHNITSKVDGKGKTVYTYDAQNRLKSVDENYINKVTVYSYDAAGNREKEEIQLNGSIAQTNTYHYNELNRLERIVMVGQTNKTVSYGYDNNGNQISCSDTGTINEYDEFNQLISTTITGGSTVENIYNAEGYRIGKKVNGTLTTYIYEYDKVVLELDGSGNANRNVYGSNLLMRTVGEDSYYYMYNGHADVTALINVATGKVDATYYYDAFGNILESTGNVDNNITYAGYQYDEETGLYYLNARMYDPKIARFLQEDTYTGDVNDPLSLNLYTYCANNPIIYWDRTGNVPAYVQIGEFIYETSDFTNGITTVTEQEFFRKNGYGLLFVADEDMIVIGEDGERRIKVRKLCQKIGIEDTISYWTDVNGKMNVVVRPETKSAPIKVKRAENDVNIIAYINFTGDADKIMPSTVTYYISNLGTQSVYPNGYSYAEIAAYGIQSVWSGNYSVDGMNINLTTTVYSNNSSPNGVIQNVPLATFSNQQYLNIEVKDKIGRSNQNDTNVFTNIWDFLFGDKYMSGDTIYDNWSITNPGKITIYTKTKYSNTKYNPKDPSTYKVYNKEELAKVVAHEFGHSLGLGDAYGENGYRFAAPEFYIMKNGITLSIPSDDIMRNSYGRVSDADVTFMLKAWQINEFQLFLKQLVLTLHLVALFLRNKTR